MISTITIGTNTINVVALPTTPGMRSVEFSMEDAVAIVSSPFTGQAQTQRWPGADMWSGTLTLPPLTQDQADEWIAFLMELRGMSNAMLIGDPAKRIPRGTVEGVPLVDGGITVAAGGETLYTKGWTPSRFRLLLAGDYLQVGYRLHRVLEVVNSDTSGKAAIRVWPSLREVPTDGEAVILNNPAGLFRLANNKRTWSSDMTRVTRLSFQILEYR